MISFFKGASYSLKGYRWCWKKGLRRYVIPPLLINISFMGILLWLGTLWVTPMLEWVQNWLPSWLMWLQWLFVGIFFVGLIWVGFLLLSVLIHLVAMPFNDALSSAVVRIVKNQGGIEVLNQKILQPQKTPARQVAHAVSDVLTRGLYTIKWLLLIGMLVFFLSFIPGVNFVAPWLMVALGGWLLALEYFDYPLAKYGHDFKQQRALLANQRYSVVGFGMLTGLMLAIPVVNLLVIPAAVIGATLFSCEQAWEQEVIE